MVSENKTVGNAYSCNIMSCLELVPYDHFSGNTLPVLFKMYDVLGNDQFLCVLDQTS